jgi:hypothetical protein
MAAEIIPPGPQRATGLASLSAGTLAVEGFWYSVFGLSLHCNLCLPDLPRSHAPTGAPEIKLHLDVAPNLDLYPAAARDGGKSIYVSPSTNESGEAALRVSEIAQGALLHLQFNDGIQFWLDRKGNTVWASWSETSSLENACSYLLGPILGLLLRLRGVVCLHASAVAFNDCCVAFVGSEGAGKSTTAAAFARSGCGIVSDDIVGLVERDARFYVLPAYPHLCLWPESVAMLYGSPEALPRFLHDWEKRRLALGQDGTRFEDRTLPLEAIYILGARGSLAAAEVEYIPNREGLLALVANSYATTLIDVRLREEEFAVLSRLIASVPVRMVHPSDDPSRLEELCSAIRADLTAQQA